MQVKFIRDAYPNLDFSTIHIFHFQVLSSDNVCFQYYALYVFSKMCVPWYTAQYACFLVICQPHKYILSKNCSTQSLMIENVYDDDRESCVLLLIEFLCADQTDTKWRDILIGWTFVDIIGLAIANDYMLRIIRTCS